MMMLIMTMMMMMVISVSILVLMMIITVISPSHSVCLTLPHTEGPLRLRMSHPRRSICG